MLQLASGVTLCMYIGDLFQLQRSFKRNGIMAAASQEQCMVLINKFFSNMTDLVIKF